MFRLKNFIKKPQINIYIFYIQKIKIENTHTSAEEDENPPFPSVPLLLAAGQVPAPHAAQARVQAAVLGMQDCVQVLPDRVHDAVMHCWFPGHVLEVHLERFGRFVFEHFWLIHGALSNVLRFKKSVIGRVCWFFWKKVIGLYGRQELCFVIKML